MGRVFALDGCKTGDAKITKVSPLPPFSPSPVGCVKGKGRNSGRDEAWCMYYRALSRFRGCCNWQRGIVKGDIGKRIFELIELRDEGEAASNDASSKLI